MWDSLALSANLCCCICVCSSSCGFQDCRGVNKRCNLLAKQLQMLCNSLHREVKYLQAPLKCWRHQVFVMLTYYDSFYFMILQHTVKYQVPQDTAALHPG